MESKIVCESKAFCESIAEDPEKPNCGTTLGLVQGAQDNGEQQPCDACKESNDKLTPVMEMAGAGTMDLSIAKMTLGMISDTNCPNTLAAGQCALDNADACMDPKTSSSSSFGFFSSLCDCPCGGRIAKFLWDLDAMNIDACQKAIGNGFTTPEAAGQSEMMPALMQSGMLDCFNCPHNGKACTESFKKWLAGSPLQQTFLGLVRFGAQGKCDEEAPTTTTTTTTTEAAALPDNTSFAPRVSPFFGFFIAVFVAMKLA
jgi:hypothetical protein